MKRRTPALAWFERVHDGVSDLNLEVHPPRFEVGTLNKLFSAAAVLCIYADKNLQIHGMSRYSLASQVGLKTTDFAAALRDLTDMGLLRLSPPRGSRAGSLELLNPPPRSSC